jgi:hypothetical protein
VEPSKSKPEPAGPTGDSGRLTFTVGKYFVDMIDDYIYARPGNTFLNWTVIDRGAFDAADSRDFTYGATAEWTQDWWTARVANSERRVINGYLGGGERTRSALAAC